VMRVTSIKTLGVAAMLLLVGAMAGAGDARIFYYGEILEINLPEGLLSVDGDDNVTWRFRVTSSTQVQKSVERPTEGTLEDLRVGAYVRVFAGWEPSDSTIREALRILVYPRR
jgi:hypothetical protein